MNIVRSIREVRRLWGDDAARIEFLETSGMHYTRGDDGQFVFYDSCGEKVSSHGDLRTAIDRAIDILDEREASEDGAPGK